MPGIPIGIKIVNYKCFGENPEGVEQIKPINVIIGRNNSGKSALVDMVQQACVNKPQFSKADWREGREAALILGGIIDESLAKSVFRPESSGGSIRGSHWEAVGKHYVGAPLVCRQASGATPAQRTAVSALENLGRLYANPRGQAQFEEALAKAFQNPLEGKLFRRLSAERDIGPEPETQDLGATASGRNITNTIQNYYSLARLNRNLIDVVLLNEFNSITEPDYSFSGIVPRKLDNNHWEIFLREKIKGLVPLSASGSGLKTILCVLAQLVLWPTHEGLRLERYVFGFEELENSLHPALLRRLLQYVDERIRREDSILFLTTHSSVAIDMFAGREDAQIIHTTHRVGAPATATVVSEYLHRRGVLDDLDVRASDLLQSNGIIWVEGPSDRIYLNHWITLASNGSLREGTHYQCVFYGGRLLAHLSADKPAEVAQLVSIFRVNRNAAVIIDSDKTTEGDELNETKKRICAEIGELGGVAWVTEGKEIENYLPAGAIKAAQGFETGEPPGKFQDFADYLERRKQGAGKRFERGKAEFAAQTIEAVKLEQQSDMLDWKDRIAELCRQIRAWNRLAQ